MSGRISLAVILALACTSALALDGKAIYDANCASCHQPDGAGAVGLAPPLLGTLGKRVSLPAGRRYVAGVLIAGLAGKLESKGVVYNGIMPNWQQFSDDELAGVANHILTTFNGPELAAGFQPYVATEFTEMRAKKASGKVLRAWRSESE